MVNALFLFPILKRMKLKSRKLLVGIFVLALFVCGQRVAAQTLVLHHANGGTTDVELYTQPRIEFQGDRVLITSPVLNMEYPKTDVLRFTYKGKSLAVTSHRAEDDMSRDSDRLVFHNVKAADQVAVYTANGIRVPIRLTRSGSDAALSLSQIPTGVYLLSVNGRTSKFTKP